MKLVANRVVYLAPPDTAAFINAVNADLFATSDNKHLQLFLPDGQRASGDRAAVSHGTACFEKSADSANRGDRLALLGR